MDVVDSERESSRFRERDALGVCYAFDFDCRRRNHTVSAVLTLSYLEDDRDPCFGASRHLCATSIPSSTVNVTLEMLS
jgi:hypothetical protein